MSKYLEPVGQRLVVKKISKSEHRGIVVPEMAKRRSLIGQVLHAGPDAQFCTEGDLILFAQYSGCEPYLDADLVKTYQEDIVVMNDEDVLCVISEKDDNKKEESQSAPAFTGSMR